MIRSEADRLQSVSADEDAEHILETFMTVCGIPKPRECPAVQVFLREWVKQGGG